MRVGVTYDPEKVSQETIGKLEPWLQQKVAEVFSLSSVLHPDRRNQGIKTSPEEFVVDSKAFCIGVPVAILIFAQHVNRRDGYEIQKILGEALSGAGLISDEHLGEGQSCIHVYFSGQCASGFIPKSGATSTTT